jgi:Ca2+-binding EF-hand superfamily protein
MSSPNPAGGESSHSSGLEAELAPVIYSVVDSAARRILQQVSTGMGAGDGLSVPPLNWFSSANSVRIYSAYLELDAGQNGLLSREELQAMHGGSLTDLFVTRVFQESHTYGGEMDYKAYLDLTLALKYRTSPASLRYMFRTLDMQRCGFLTLKEIRLFLKEIVARLMQAGHDPIDVANICDEIFDMVKPAEPDRVTLADLERSGTGHTVLHILTDAAGFYNYDQRESLMHQQPAEAPAASLEEDDV